MFRLSLIFLVTLVCWACQPEKASSSSDLVRPEGRPWKLICLGDGITAGVGLPKDSLAYPAHLASLLTTTEDSVQVVNASLKGETLTAAVTRLPWMFQQRFDALLIALGDAALRQQVDVAEWTRDWEELLVSVRAIDPEIKLWVMIVSAQEASSNYEQRVKDLAITYKANWLALPTHDRAAHPAFWQGNPAQLTPTGHRWLADWLAKSIKREWGE